MADLQTGRLLQHLLRRPSTRDDDIPHTSLEDEALTS